MTFNIYIYKVLGTVKWGLPFYLLTFSPLSAIAQDKIVNPDISYAGTPRTCEIAGIAVEGVDGYEDYVLTGLSGLSVGQQIEVPGSQITEAVKRYWRNGLFSKVSITADSIVGSKIYLCIHLGMRPRIHTIRYHGVKKSEREDLETKLGMVRGMSLTRNVIDRAKILAKKYFDEKGYKNAEIDIVQMENPSDKNQVLLDVNIDKKAKMKVHRIYFDGNEKLKDSKIKGTLFSKGSFGKIHESGKLINLFKSKKFTDERYKDAKLALIEKYNELGFRDATILVDSVSTYDDKHVDIHVKLDEGDKYYIREITWVGNTVVTTDYLNAVLGMKRGDVYNQKHINKRLKEDDDAAGNYYYNNGYVFSNIDPVEVNIDGDSIDVEMRVTFNKEALQRTVREIASMGFFDPEKIVPDVVPNYEDGTVDINYKLEQKSNDQLEFSLGWGQTGIIGKIGIKFNNFSIRNLFGKNKLHRGILPYGDGEQLGFSFQTNGSYYSSLSANYGTNWFGGKRPNSFNVGLFFSKQSDISSLYRNNSFYNNYAMYSYGIGSYNNNYYNYDSMLDDDKTMTVFGATVGWGKRLRWPDDYFQFQAVLGYTRYMLRDWNYFYIHNGNCNNINLGLTLSRT